MELLTETAAGGAMSEVAVPLGDDPAVQEFNAQFETDALPTRVQDAVAETTVPDDMLLYGAVVAIGCDSPTDVSVVTGDVRAGDHRAQGAVAARRVLRTHDHRGPGAR